MARLIRSAFVLGSIVLVAGLANATLIEVPRFIYDYEYWAIPGDAFCAGPPSCSDTASTSLIGSGEGLPYGDETILVDNSSLSWEPRPDLSWDISTSYRDWYEEVWYEDEVWDWVRHCDEFGCWDVYEPVGTDWFFDFYDYTYATVTSYEHVFEAVPEASTALLVGAGLIGIAVAGRRRSHH